MKGEKKVFKSKESEDRNKIHRFGQPRGNRRGNPSVAVETREFYRWVESKATENDLKAYIDDESNPFVRRKFINMFLNTREVSDYFALTNQIHGQPKQTIDVHELPKIDCSAFGE